VKWKSFQKQEKKLLKELKILKKVIIYKKGKKAKELK
jgi:hypothetical protein